jgi:hypothetical protein
MDSPTSPEILAEMPPLPAIATTPDPDTTGGKTSKEEGERDPPEDRAKTTATGGKTSKEERKNPPEDSLELKPAAKSEAKKKSAYNRGDSVKVGVYDPEQMKPRTHIGIVSSVIWGEKNTDKTVSGWQYMVDSVHGPFDEEEVSAEGR